MKKRSGQTTSELLFATSVNKEDIFWPDVISFCHLDLFLPEPSWQVLHIQLSLKRSIIWCLDVSCLVSFFLIFTFIHIGPPHGWNISSNFMVCGMMDYAIWYLQEWENSSGQSMFILWKVQAKIERRVAWWILHRHFYLWKRWQSSSLFPCDLPPLSISPSSINHFSSDIIQVWVF